MRCLAYFASKVERSVPALSVMPAQVVTIQDVVARRVWRPSTMAAMLAPRGLHAEMPNAEQVQVERMWPGSVQMPLVDIEDNCMARLQVRQCWLYKSIAPQLCKETRTAADTM